MVQNVRLTLTREARQIVGADIVVQSPRPWTAESRAILDRALARERVTRTEVIETRTMAAAEEGKGSGKVRLVELHGVEAGFPFYGTIELEGGAPYSRALLTGFGALVPPEFLLEMGLSVGDAVRLGGRAFTIRGVVTHDRVQRRRRGVRVRAAHLRRARGPAQPGSARVRQQRNLPDVPQG